MRLVYGEKRNDAGLMWNRTGKTPKANNARRLYGSNQYTTLYKSKWFMLTWEMRRMENGEMCDVRAVGRIVTNSIDQSPSWERNGSSASQEIPCILWNPKVHSRIQNSLPPVTIPRQINPVHALASYLLKIHFYTILPSTPRSRKWSFPLILAHLYAPHLFPHVL